MSAKKQVIFCTYSSIYSSIVLEKLIDEPAIDLVAIINSTRVLSPSMNAFQGALYQLKMSGLRYSFYLCFITSFYKYLKPFCNSKLIKFKDIATLSKEHNIPIVETKNINTTEISNIIQQLKPDYLLCAHFNQLLKTPVLSLENVECINIHPSLLPKYKGVDPVFYSMQDNTPEIGVTLHKMNDRFDSGELLLQSSMPLNKSNSLLLNNYKLFEEGAKLAIDWMKDSTLYQVVKIQNSNDDNYDSWPARKDIKQFKMLGNKLIDLSLLWKKL